MARAATLRRRLGGNDMERMAVICGLFVGAVLKECAPVLAEILAEGIRRAFANTVEDGKAPDGLGDALRARIAAGMRNKNGDSPEGRSGPNP